MSLLLALIAIPAVSLSATVADVSVASPSPSLTVGALSLSPAVAGVSLTVASPSLAVGSLALATSVAAVNVTAQSPSLAVGSLSIATTTAHVTAIAFDARIPNPPPSANRYSLSLAVIARRGALALTTRAVALSFPRRVASLALLARPLSLSLPRRLLVSDRQGFTKGDVSTPLFTLTADLSGTAQTIAQPDSLACLLYPVDSTTVAATIAVTVGDCTGWGTTSVAVPVAFTSGNTPVAGVYNVEIVATYVAGTVRWPENRSVIQLEIRTPGAP